MANNNETDPLIQALPPATDYLTYLTLIEYQLTHARLPILHQVLQDETLTTNIGWDLVHLLLPLLPASRECLEDVARLGNPREVILRVSDGLMKLEPADENDEEEDDDDNHEEENAVEGGEEVNPVSNPEPHPSGQKLPLHILQFSSLLSMLSVLHSRIKTKYPSRFIATSLQAALEAYTEFPTPETTVAMLELLRDVSGKKRPALPPRNPSEQLLSRSVENAAPDPEAETQLDESKEGEQGSGGSNENYLIQRLLQFGIVEVLKTYILHCTDKPSPAGMHWAIRLQEKIHPNRVMNTSVSYTTEFWNTEQLKERDRTLGRIVALSRDFGLDTELLLNIISTPEKDLPPPLDFDDIPKSTTDIPLERHGCVLLLAARYMNNILFGSGDLQESISLYPDIVNLLTNFLDGCKSPCTAVADQPTPLIDSILSLAAIASNNTTAKSPPDELGFKTLVLGLTACARGPPSLRAISQIESIPADIFHAYPNQQSRFNLISEIFQDDGLQHARIPATQWLKKELLAYTTTTSNKSDEEKNIFADPDNFSKLFSHIYKYTAQKSPSSSSSITWSTWMQFIQDLAPLYLAKLNLYYFLCKSSILRERLHLSTLQPLFDADFLTPLKEFVQNLSGDAEVSAQVAMEVGEPMVEMGQSAAEVVMYVIGQIEEEGETT